MSKNLALLLLGLCCLLLAGCQYWYKDMKGYLEYWSATLEVGEVQVQVEPESQVDSSGRTTISTNAAVVVSAVVENPDGHVLNPGVGPASDILKSVRISGPAGSAALSRASVAVVGLTGIEMRLDPLSSVPTPESLRVEHKDFSVLLAPVRTETNMSPSEPKSLTFRYNTPPRMPLAVVESGGTLKFPDSATSWEVVSGSSQSDLDDLIFWAYPSGITDPTHPDCVASFRVTDGVDVEEQPASEYLMSREVDLRSLIPQDLVNAGYDVYCYLAINGGPVTVEAVDGEGVRGAGITSGALTAITLNADGGTFGNGGSSVTVYRANGASLNGGDLDIPTKSGYYLSGWVTSTGAVTFPYTVSSSVTFTAQWTANPVSGGGSGGGTPVVDPYTFYVNPSSGSDSNPGTKASPLKTLDKALEKVMAANDGSGVYTIRLMENYDGSQSAFSLPGNALMSVSPTKALRLYITSDGGPYTIDAQRNSGSTGRVLYVDGDANVTLENITLTGGHIAEGGGAYVMSGGSLTVGSGAVVSGNTATSGDGGGIYAAGELVIDGGSISNNEASSISGIGAFGGGVHVATGGSLALSGTANISNNKAANGAGVSLGMNVVATMDGGTISGNTASSDGGGVYVSSDATLTITGGTIGGIGSPNTAVSNGGGIYIGGNGTVSLDGTTISHNTASENGGSIYASGGQLSIQNARINGNGVHRNSGGATIQGVGLHLSNATTTITNTVISGNTVNGSAQFDVDGGGIYLAGGTLNIESGTEISGHDTAHVMAGTSFGGGLYMKSGTVNMNGGTISGNTAWGSRVDNDAGQGVYIQNGTFSMGGAATVAADNDVYLLQGTITVTSPLTGSQPVATITPFSYTAGTQILTASGSVKLADEAVKFAVTPNGGTQYFVDNTGTLQQQP